MERQKIITLIFDDIFFGQSFCSFPKISKFLTTNTNSIQHGTLRFQETNRIYGMLQNIITTQSKIHNRKDIHPMASLTSSIIIRMRFLSITLYLQMQMWTRRITSISHCPYLLSFDHTISFTHLKTFHMCISRKYGPVLTLMFDTNNITPSSI